MFSEGLQYKQYAYYKEGDSGAEWISLGDTYFNGSAWFGEASVFLCLSSFACLLLFT